MTQVHPRIVFLDAATYGDVSLQSFTTRWDCTIHDVSRPTDVRIRLAGHSVAIINKVALNREVLGSAEARDLKLIAVAATGTDNVDRAAAKERNILICNVPGYATQSVAQFTFTLILELATHAGRYGELVRRDAWQRSPIFTLHDYPSVELEGKSLGVIGYGNIGRAVAKMGQNFGLQVLICARPGSTAPTPPDRISLDDLLRRADFITLHCPLTPFTKNLIDRRNLALMKPTAFLINTSRGGLVDEAALIEALRFRRLAGAALDVISEEPPRPDHPILRAAKEMDRLLVTPHCAWSAREARLRLLNEVAENIAAYFRGESRNLVGESSQIGPRREEKLD